MNSILRSFRGDVAVALAVLVTMASACADATTTTARGAIVPQGGPTAAQAAAPSSPSDGTKVGGATARVESVTPAVEKVPSAKDLSGGSRFREPTIHLRR